MRENGELERKDQKIKNRGEKNEGCLFPRMISVSVLHTVDQMHTMEAHAHC